MKLGFGRKLVLFLHWLLSLIVFAFAVLWCVMPQLADDIPEIINRVIGAGVAEIACIAFAVIYVLLAVFSVAFIFSRDKKRGERGFITVDNNESGRTRIAIGAVEQMIRQAVRSVEGIAEMKCAIQSHEDTISINTSVSIISGAHVPTVTMNIQRAVRNYIELNCGVVVREVCVSVNALSGDDESSKGRRKAFVPAPAAVPVMEPAQTPVEEAKPAVEEIISAVEEAPLEPQAETEEKEICE